MHVSRRPSPRRYNVSGAPCAFKSSIDRTYELDLPHIPQNKGYIWPEMTPFRRARMSTVVLFLDCRYSFGDPERTKHRAFDGNFLFFADRENLCSLINLVSRRSSFWKKFDETSNRIFFDQVFAKDIEIDENYAIKIAVKLREYDHDLNGDVNLHVLWIAAVIERICGNDIFYGMCLKHSYFLFIRKLRFVQKLMIRNCCDI